MNDEISKCMYDALKLKYHGDFTIAKASMLVYFNNAVGIGEHPNLVAAVDSEVEKLADATDKLSVLVKTYPDYS